MHSELLLLPSKMIYLLLFCLSLFLFEAASRPSNDVQASRMPSLDQFTILRMCRRPMSTGSPNCRAMPVKQWYYDGSTQTCKRFVWSGCGGNGNDNRFESRTECEDRCQEVSPCRSILPSRAPFGCKTVKTIDISDGCPVYHWDCHDTPRTGSCPPAIDIGPLPSDCSIISLRTAAGCSKDIVTCL